MFNCNKRWNNRTELFSFWGGGGDGVEASAVSESSCVLFVPVTGLTAFWDMQFRFSSALTMSSIFFIACKYNLNWYPGCDRGDVQKCRYNEIVLFSTAQNFICALDLLGKFLLCEVFHVERGAAVGWRVLMVPSRKQRQFEQMERGFLTFTEYYAGMVTDVDSKMYKYNHILCLEWCRLSHSHHTFRGYPLLYSNAVASPPLLSKFYSYIHLTNRNSMVPTSNVLTIGTVPMNNVLAIGTVPTYKHIELIYRGD